MRRATTSIGILASALGILAMALPGCDRDSDGGGQKPEEAPAESATSAATASPATGNDEGSSGSGKASGGTPDDLPRGLLVAYSQFPVGDDGKATAKPGAALLEILIRQDGEWSTVAIEDDESNVFHKAMVLDGAGPPAIVTLGAEDAKVKAWRRTAEGFVVQTLWTAEFGGRFDRMRDAEVGDVDGDGRPEIVVGTHDQGVIAVLDGTPAGEPWSATRLHEAEDTFIHEIELGDLNGDGELEIYATPSEPNDLSGKDVQRGTVIRLDPAKPGSATVVANLGDRHAKEILVDDVDGDGRDELYVAVEGKTEGSGSDLRVVEPVEIRRYDAGTPADEGAVIARIEGERFTRFLTPGDVEGDGRKEIVAASFRKGLWLLRPGTDPKGEWGIESIDRESSGFEHAALLTDLDADGRAELYVAADEQGALRRYVWVDGRPRREVIAERAVPASRMTWNLMPVPRALVQPG